MTDVKTEIKDEALKHHMKLVRLIAVGMWKKINFAVPLNELEQLGAIGLMEAIERFDPARDNKFSTYAEFRIRGAMLDELRKDDPVSRFARDQRKAIDAVIEEFQREHNREPRQAEIAETMNLSVEELGEKLMASTHEMISIDDGEKFTAEDRRALQSSVIRGAGDMELKIEAMQKLRKKVDGHTSVDRAAYLLYFLWGLDLNEIGEVFGVSSSRISQRVNYVARDMKSTFIDRHRERKAS